MPEVAGRSSLISYALRPGPSFAAPWVFDRCGMLQRHFKPVGCACQALWHLICTLGFLGNHGLGSQRGALHGCA